MRGTATQPEMPLEALILVGGKGTRLQSVVRDRPKPMAEVAGRPFLEWLLLALRSQGVRRVLLCTGYLGQMIEDYFSDGKRWDMDLGYSCEPSPLGTAGAVRLAWDQVQGARALVLNGDSYCRADFQELTRKHILSSANATLWLVKVDDCSRYGSVEIDGSGVVRSFNEKSTQVQTGLVNGGVYLLEDTVVETIPKGRMVSLEMEVFPQWVERGLYAVAGDGPLLDIGTPGSYALAAEHLGVAGVPYTSATELDCRRDHSSIREGR